MFSADRASPLAAPAANAAHGLERLDHEAKSAYWLRFLNGRWLVYWHERVIANFPAEKAATALGFLRLFNKQQGPELGERRVHFCAAATQPLAHRAK